MHSCRNITKLVEVVINILEKHGIAWYIITDIVQNQNESYYTTVLFSYVVNIIAKTNVGNENQWKIARGWDSNIKRWGCSSSCLGV